jgi:predicted amidophosphoribosyltransferase
MSEVKHCPKCHNVQERGKFCSQCGYDLSSEKQPAVIQDLTSHRTSSYEQAAYQYHVAGARLFNLLYTVAVIGIIINVLALIFMCLSSASIMGLFGNVVRQIVP